MVQTDKLDNIQVKLFFQSICTINKTFCYWFDKRPMWYIISCCYGNSYVRRTYQRLEIRIRKHVPKYTIDLFINKVLTMQKEAINIFTGWRWPHRPQQSSNRCWRRRNDVLAVCKGDVTDMQTNCNFKHVEGSLWVAALHTAWQRLQS